MKAYAAIDPGKDGGVAIIHPNDGLETLVTPTIGKEYDKYKMCSVIGGVMEKYNGNVHFVLENINGHVAKGRTTAFIMGKGKGLWEMALVALFVPHTLVTPQAWQKEMWKGVKVQKKSNGRKDTKSMSLIASQRVFPGHDFTKSERSKTPHDGMIDAALMAEYGRRMNY